MNIYKELAQGGGYNLPYLVHIYTTDNATHIYLVNDNKDIEYKGHKYLSSNFTYTPNLDGDSSFSVELVEHDEIIDVLENNYVFNTEVVGILNGATVEELSQYKHSYGEGTWDGAKLEMKLNKDDRGNMTFPALIFTSYNNRGNN